jgi:hypothetical protein
LSKLINPNKKLFFQVLIIFLITLYGIISVKINSKQLSLIDGDEYYYQRGGIEILKDSSNIHQFHDHPPFSMWFGALPSYFGNKGKLSANVDDLGANHLFRKPHIYLYIFTGIILATMLFLYESFIASILFSIFYWLAPNLKANASLHITDTDFLCFLGLSSLLLYFISTNKLSKWSTSVSCLSGLLWGLSLGCKISSALFIPFYMFYLLYYSPRDKKIINFSVIALFGTIGMLIAYRFDFKFLSYFMESIDFVRSYNKKGIISFLFGTYSYHGQFFFFPLLFLFKTPITWLIFLSITFFLYIKKYNQYSKIAQLYFFPAIIIAVIMFNSSLHIGYRHFLYIDFSLMIGSIILVASYLKDKQNTRLSFIAIAVLLICSLATDFYTLKKDLYLSYFNILTPRPTRNFCNSNNDWAQSLTKTLSDQYPNFLETKKISGLDLLVGQEKNLKLRAGASDLCGIHSNYFDMYLLAFTPVSVAGGFEFFSITNTQLYDSIERLPYIENPLNKSSIDLLSVNLDKNLHTCPEGKKREIKEKKLFTDLATKKAVVNISNDKKYILFVESARALKVKYDSSEFVFTNRNDIIKKWDILKPNQRMEIEIDADPSLRKQDFKISILWSDCSN